MDIGMVVLSGMRKPHVRGDEPVVSVRDNVNRLVSPTCVGMNRAVPARRSCGAL